MGDREATVDLFVGNVPHNMDDAALAHLFSDGNEAPLGVQVKRRDPPAHGFAFVSFASRATAARAKELMHGTRVGDTTLAVGWAQVNRTLCVVNWPPTLDAAVLTAFAAEQCAVDADETRVLREHGCAFVTAQDRDGAVLLMERLHGAHVDGADEPLCVRWGRSSTESTTVYVSLRTVASGADAPRAAGPTELRRAFAAFGDVQRVRMPREMQTEETRIAFVRYTDTRAGEAAASLAIAVLDGTELGNAMLSCKLARRRATSSTERAHGAAVRSSAANSRRVATPTEVFCLFQQQAAAMQQRTNMELAAELQTRQEALRMLRASRPLDPTRPAFVPRQVRPAERSAGAAENEQKE